MECALAEPISATLPSAPILYDPSTSGLSKPYQYVSSPSVGFDDSGNFYILSEYSNLGAISGAVTLQKFTFTGTVPAQDAFTNNHQTPNPYGGSSADLKVIYQWVSSANSDQALDPTMSVDGNLATIPAGVASPADANSGNIYVSWATVDLNSANPIVPFNPNRIVVEVSSDGGNNFSPMSIATTATAGTDNGNSLPTERDATPALVVSQGRQASESGKSGDVGITAGQATVTFNDFGDNRIMANTITSGTANSFGENWNRGSSSSASSPSTSSGIAVGGESLFSVNVTGVPVTAGTLDITLNAVDSVDQYLTVGLEAPSGQTYLLAGEGRSPAPTSGS